ncbi:hypothetical protein [Dongia sp.]|uniref:hypothetical protein n=1 Tax=Dongia sp. TaxID=1977262 RepID=UPI00375064E0
MNKFVLIPLSLPEAAIAMTAPVRAKQRMVLPGADFITESSNVPRVQYWISDHSIRHTSFEGTKA